MRLTAGIHYIPFFKKFNDRDVENIILRYLNANANAIRVFLYYDGRDELMNYYEKKDSKFDLDKFSKEYFDRIKLLGQLAIKYDFILKLDVLDNCSFFKDLKYKHPFYNNIQNIKMLPDDIYNLNPKIKPYIKKLFKKHWNILKPYKEHIKIGFMNEATKNNPGSFNFKKYEPIAKWHKNISEILEELKIPRKYWRINPQTEIQDYIKSVNGEEGEIAWSYSMGLMGAESGKCKNVEGEVHGLGLKKLNGIIPEMFLNTVFTPAFNEVSFSDDGTNDGSGENEGNNKWCAETADEFANLFEKVLIVALKKGKHKASVEHLTRDPEKYIEEIEGDMSIKKLKNFINENTLIYFKKANDIYKKHTGESLRKKQYDYIPKIEPECKEEEEIKYECEDGTYIVIKKCINGKWIKTNEKCIEHEDCSCWYYLETLNFKRFFQCLLKKYPKKCK